MLVELKAYSEKSPPMLELMKVRQPHQKTKEDMS